MILKYENKEELQKHVSNWSNDSLIKQYERNAKVVKVRQIKNQQRQIKKVEQVEKNDKKKQRAVGIIEKCFIPAMCGLIAVPMIVGAATSIKRSSDYRDAVNEVRQVEIAYLNYLNEIGVDEIIDYHDSLDMYADIHAEGYYEVVLEAMEILDSFAGWDEEDIALKIEEDFGCQYSKTEILQRNGKSYSFK